MNEAMGHGAVGRREQDFTHLLPLRTHGFPVASLAVLAELMKGEVDKVKDGPDPEENLWVPAGYTYLGQFVDHDLTFDSTSSLDPLSDARPTNLRTPRFDLDCVYGDGPAGMPYLYDTDGATLLYRHDPFDPNASPTANAHEDLARNVNERAIIGDKRNDENSIVSQIQLAFIKYHNAIVKALKARGADTWTAKNDLFASARNEVRWTYQKLLVDDFLPRIISADVLHDLAGKTKAQRAGKYALYTVPLRSNLPREFVAAAYRFGHSGVRTGYRMNSGLANRFSIFPASDDDTTQAGALSLLGFDAVTANQVIDNWGRFFPDTLPGDFGTEDRSSAADLTPNGDFRLQWAYKLDPTLVDPLGVLPRQQVGGEGTTQEAEKLVGPLPDTKVTPPRPSLALLNLLRGNTYGIQSGQEVAKFLRMKGMPARTLEPKHLSTRQLNDVSGKFQFTPISADLQADTPLWFYVLAEAQAPIVDALGTNEFDEDLLLTGPGSKTQLGWVGGRIVAEVFYGLLDSDPESFINAAPAGWKPWLDTPSAPVIFRHFLRVADPGNS